MKIAIVRGNFLSSWEIPIFEPIARKHEVTLFLGKKPVYNVKVPKNIKVVKLLSPVDLNFGKISRWKMAILNRLFIDAHWLFGLQNALKSYDTVYIAESFYAFSLQSVLARQKGYVKQVVMHVGENIAFNNEGIWGRKWLKRTALSGTDKFVAITDAARDVLIEEGVDKNKIIRATPGIDLSHFKKFPVKKYKNINKNSNIKLLIVSRLVGDKGILEMIETFINLSKKNQNIELIVVGQGPLEESARTLLKTHGLGERSHFFGSVPYQDMPKVYNLCDIFIHYPKGTKTWQEQFGFVMLEAMACGLAIVALNHGSVKEVLGNNGLAVREGMFESTIEKLLINSKLRSEFQREALKKANSDFDVKKYSNNLIKIFTSNDY